MDLIGGSVVACEFQAVNDEPFYAFNPRSGEQLQPGFAESNDGQIEAATLAAERDFNRYRSLPFAQRADFLLEIVAQLQGLGQDLVARAHLETGLPLARLEGELTRTTNQLKMFADYVREGTFLQTHIDPALPEREPAARPDLRKTQVPLGPVVVFGASNFPLAFSVAGGDTAAALAAGCPVIVKAHPAHPGTCELAALAIVRAVKHCNLPKGTFSLLQGSRHELGAELVQHPLVQAVAFTGSQAVGRALFALAAARPAPIPVFAEMGSVNPIFVLPQALIAGGDKLAKDYAESVALGVGQFCTNPGLLFVVNCPELDPFFLFLKHSLAQMAPAPMLHRGIKLNYQRAFSSLAGQEGVEISQAKESAENDCHISPALLKTTAERFLADSVISKEVFGPSAVVVVCDSAEQMQQCAASLQGQLTATVHAVAEEEGLCRDFFTILERKAGRLILNGFPTGVEVCHAMVHGGPYPATTDSRTTSVGTDALYRFLRPVCVQNFSAALLPVELRKA